MALDGIKRRLAKVEARRPPNSDLDAWVRSLSDAELDARILSITAELEANGVDLSDLDEQREPLLVSSEIARDLAAQTEAPDRKT